MKDNKIKIGHLLFMISMMGIIIVVGTYAWLSYRSNDTAMVLTIGEINNVQVTLSPYQIKASLLPQVTYTSDKYVNVTAVNNSNTSRKVKLYYRINNIDAELISSDFKYTIERSTDGTNYSKYGTDGNFSSASNGAEIIILEENIPNNTTYQYKVYLWIDGTNSGQSYMQGKSFNGELRAEILSYNVTFDANGGIVNIGNKAVSYGEQYGDLPTPTRTGYAFLGWNGANMFNIDNFVDFYAPYQNQHAEKTTFDGYEVWKIYGAVNATGRSLQYMDGVFKENTSYIISFNEYEVWAQSGNSTYPGIIIYVIYTDGTSYTLNGREHDHWTNINYISSENKTISFLRVSYGTGPSYTYFKDFQIKEEISSTYEPYYITNTTTVVQNKDHTLTARWQEN